MVTQLQDVANTVAQEKISNQRLRNEEIRRQMANPWSEPIETPTTSTGIQPLQNAAASGNTLASTYSSLLNNYNSYQNATGQTSSGNTTFGNPGITGSIPSWAPTAVGTGLSMAGAGIAAPIGAASMSLMRGDRAGAAGTLGSLFTNVATKGSIPGLPGVVGSVASGLIGDKSTEEIGQSVFNSVLGTGLGMVNPALGYGYNLARMFGLNVSRGISDYSKSDISQRFDAGYNGGFWGDGSWSPTAPYSPTNTYSGSGYGNTAGPGSSGYSWSSSSSSSGYPSSGSWSSYSSGSAYSSDSDSESSYGGW